MAFKKAPPPTSAPDSPDKLFLDLPRRKYTGLLDHQGQMLRTYAKEGANASDVALQLPTGSGKTLVGLLIAEWRRRKFQERVAYLCPTNQLVNQVVEEARTKYGLDVDGFTGATVNYDPAAKARYQTADRVAVTNYNSLFNTNPFFKTPELVIVDDAHAAESYISQMWTLRIDRFESKHAALFAALANVLKPLLDPHFHARLVSESLTPQDRAWVDKVATPDFLSIADELRAVFDTHVEELELRYKWKVMADHIEACQLYLSATEILLRPLIPPTWSHEPFEDAKQRIFMSATLGAGGDLERLTGRRAIKRLAIPEGWDTQGIGRRFFMFPGMSLSDDETLGLRHRLMTEAGRSLVLVPSDSARAAVEKDIAKSVGYATFSADDIEKTKRPFVDSDKAVAIVANRYDGIDFPGEDCRLLFVDGLPKAVNLQERFLMSRMGANLLFNERVQTRVLQAVGRCTRGLNDFSAVVVSGAELADYLVDKRRRAYLHPELQAEIEFGIDQSREVDVDGLVENFGIFLEHEEAWEDVNLDILAKRSKAKQVAFPAMDELGAAVKHEIAYQMRMWQGDYQQAFEEARSVLGLIVHSDLQGYRALWHYLAGSAATMAAKEGVAGFEGKARAQFSRAKEAAKGIPWLVTLSRYDTSTEAADKRNAVVMQQIERVENALAALGKLHNRAFAKREKEILSGLAGAADFEAAQTQLGELLGFSVGKVEEDASPDPWWLADGIGFVFEDHAGATSPDPLIDATKARQAASHVDWMRTNVPAAEQCQVLAVLVTSAAKASKGALPSLKKVAYWPLAEFREWAKTALGVVRELRTTFQEPGDIEWRLRAAEAFEAHGMDAPTLHESLSARMASAHMQFVDA